MLDKPPKNEDSVQGLGQVSLCQVIYLAKKRLEKNELFFQKGEKTQKSKDSVQGLGQVSLCQAIDSTPKTVEVMTGATFKK